MKCLWRAVTRGFTRWSFVGLMGGVLGLGFGVGFGAGFGLTPANADANANANANRLQVMDLSLSPDAAWQRGTPAQEREEDAILLSWPGQGGPALRVVIPQSPSLLKSDEETFYRNVSEKWAMLYGRKAAIGWVSIDQHGQSVLEKFTPGHPQAGGKEPIRADIPATDQLSPTLILTLNLTPAGAAPPRWLSCRRPARSGDDVVFHLVTVHQGRAYSVLLFAPKGTVALSQDAVRLLASSRFKPLVTLPTGKSAVMTGEPISRWKMTRSVMLSPQGEALEALVQLEVDALGEAGMVTGYGVKSGAVHQVKSETKSELTSTSASTSSANPTSMPTHNPVHREYRMRWFLEGFRWNESGKRDERVPFKVRGGYVADVPDGLSIHAKDDLTTPRVDTFRIQADPDTTELALHVRVHDYCGPLTDWDAGVEALERGTCGLLERAQRSHACEQADPASGRTSDTSAGFVLEVGAGVGTNSAERFIKEGALKSIHARAKRRWVEVRLMPPQAVGETLLSRLGMIWVYEPDEPDEPVEAGGASERPQLGDTKRPLD